MQELQSALDQLEAELVPAEVEALPEGAELVEAVTTEEPVQVTAVEAEAEVEIEAPVEEPVGPEGEPVIVAEPEIEEAVAVEAVAAPEGGPVEEEEPSTFDQLFALRPDVLTFETADEEDLEEDDDKKKKKKKKKFVEMEFDPDRNAMVVKKKRKRGGEWDETSW
jgi:N utilization substance protein A